jgi:hypothetical protein
MTRVVELRIGIVAVPADSVPLSSSLPRTYLRAIVWRPFGAGVGWATRGLRPADSRGRLSLHEFNVKIPTLSRQTTGEGRGTPPKTLSEAKNLCTSLTARAAPAGGEVPRPAKCAGLRMTRIDASDLRSVCDQFEAGTPPYFCSHFNSSRTLIFPCQGFLPRPWPSPGKISNLFGMPSE